MRPCTNLALYALSLQPMVPKCNQEGFVVAKYWHPGQTMMARVLLERFCLSAGSVQYYFRHSVKLGDQLHHYFGCVTWYTLQTESASLASQNGNPLMVSKNKFSQGGPSSFIQVARIYSRFAYVELQLEGQNF